MRALMIALVAMSGTLSLPAIAQKVPEQANPAEVTSQEPVLICRFWARDGSVMDMVGTAPIFRDGVPNEIVRFACVRAPESRTQPSAGDVQEGDDELEREIGIRPPPMHRNIVLM